MLRSPWSARIVLLCLACASACAPGPKPGTPAGGQTVRVGLLEGQSAVTVQSSDAMQVTVGPGMLHGTMFDLVSGTSEMSLSGPGGGSRGRKVVCESRSPISVNGAAYRGKIEVVQTSKGLMVVNEVGVEDYLRGVVPPEIGYLRPEEIEAMKAQAIAARTYSLAHLGRRASQGFDLYSDARDQMYGGVAAESEIGNRAVEATRGKVMVYQGKYIRAFFHGTCGGSTVNIEDVWDSPPVPYLRRVYDADERGFHCQDSRHFRWVEVYSRRDAQQIIEKNLPSAAADAPRAIGGLREVTVESQALSGRALTTRIVSDRGTWQVPKDEVRSVLRRPIDGTPMLRSSYVRLFTDRTPDGFLARLVVSGGGNGHGIGMCQWGAIGMARKGYTAEQIVKHYYRGIQILDYRAARIASVMTDAPAGEG